MAADFLVHDNHGSVVMVEPVTAAAKQFVGEHLAVAGWQWLGPCFAVDHHMVDGLADFIEEHGHTWAYTDQLEAR